jgi:NADH-quinone oxidoreductase subunit J
MMLDVDFVELRQGFLNYLPVGALVGIVLLAELLIVLGGWVFAPEAISGTPVAPITDTTNTAALGEIIYTRFAYYFQAAGLVLLVAMIGAIVLTLRHKEGVKRQSIAVQNERTPATAIDIRKVESGKGLG